MANGLHKLICLVCLLGCFAAGGAAAEVKWRYPSPDTAWGPRQYAFFQQVFFQAHLALPHLRSAESRALFDRLVDRGNIERIIAEPESRAERLRKLGIIWAALGAIRADYNGSVLSGEPLQEELTRLQIFQLFVAGTIVALAGPDAIASNSSSAIRTQVLGVVRSLGEGHIYSGAQIAALSDTLAERFPGLSQIFSDSERTELRNQIASLASQAPDAETRVPLSRLLAIIAAH